MVEIIEFENLFVDNDALEYGAHDPGLEDAFPIVFVGFGITVYDVDGTEEGEGVTEEGEGVTEEGEGVTEEGEGLTEEGEGVNEEGEGVT